MKKAFTLTILSFSMSAAFATDPVISTGVANQGSINNRVSTYASSIGIGSSYSSATGAASASANAQAVVTPVTTNPHGAPGVGANMSISGSSSTSNTGTAFNVSTGAGTGSATSRGWADADATASANYSRPGQGASLNGTTNSTGANGTDLNLTAVKNQGIAGSAATHGSFSGSGSVGASVVFAPTGAQDKFVWGNVQDNKTSSSQAGVTGMTVDGVQLTPGTGSASAYTVVTVTGSVVDPQ
jgi:hypothetical protein